VLHSFDTDGGCSEFGFVYGGVVIGSNGLHYGTTAAGPDDGGKVYALTPPDAPGAPWTQTTLHRFLNFNGGLTPTSNVVIGPDGVLYWDNLPGRVRLWHRFFARTVNTGNR